MDKAKKRLWKKMMIIFIIVGAILLLLPTMMVITGVGVSTPVPLYDYVEGNEASLKIKNFESDENINIRISKSYIATVLDQASCIWSPSHIMINAHPDTGVWVYQPVTNDGEPLEAVSFVVTEVGNAEWPLCLGVMKNRPTTIEEFADLNNWQRYGFLEPGVLPTKNPDLYIVTLDFTANPLNIPADQTFYLVIASDNLNTFNNYIGISLWDDINHGKDPEQCCYKHDGWNYVFYTSTAPNGETLPPGFYEMKYRHVCFATYTTTGGGGGEPPSISINFSTWSIISHATGFVSLVAAAVSGSKYFGFL